MYEIHIEQHNPKTTTTTTSLLAKRHYPFQLRGQTSLSFFSDVLQFQGGAGSPSQQHKDVGRISLLHHGDGGGDSDGGGSNRSNQQQQSSSILKKWKCPVCNRTYTRKGDLKFHFTQKHPNRGRDFPDVVKTRSTKSNKLFPCPLLTCNSGYMRKSDLKNHFVMKHPFDVYHFPELVPNQIYYCEVTACHRTFARRGNLQDHYKFHHDETSARLIGTFHHQKLPKEEEQEDVVGTWYGGGVDLSDMATETEAETTETEEEPRPRLEILIPLLSEVKKMAARNTTRKTDISFLLN